MEGAIHTHNFLNLHYHLDLYYNQLVDILINKVGIDRKELFIKSGNKSKREFISELNHLESTYRIATKYGRHIYLPGILLLVELNQQ